MSRTDPTIDPSRCMLRNLSSVVNTSRSIFSVVPASPAQIRGGRLRHGADV